MNSTITLTHEHIVNAIIQYVQRETGAKLGKVKIIMPTAMELDSGDAHVSADVQVELAKPAAVCTGDSTKDLLSDVATKLREWADVDAKGFTTATPVGPLSRVEAQRELADIITQHVKDNTDA